MVCKFPIFCQADAFWYFENSRYCTRTNTTNNNPSVENYGIGIQTQGTSLKK